MDFRLSEPERMLQEAARRFAEQEVRPLAAALDQGAPFPWELVRRAGELGYLGLPYSEALGGAGAGHLALGLVVEQIARASMGVAAIVSVHHLATETIARFGTSEQQARLLPPLTSGRGLGAFAFTEAATGSNPRDITTKAIRVPGGYRISGEKAFISLGPQASLCIVFAQAEGGLSAFAVELPAEGFVPGPVLGMLGARALPTAPASFQEVFVSEENLLGQPGQGFPMLLDVIANGKLCVAFQAVGVAQRALELSCEYASQRQAYGAPIHRLQSIQWLLAELAVRVEAARWLAYRCMAVRDEGQPAIPEAAMAKLFCSRAAVETTDMAMQIHGAYGYITGSEVERLYRDAKLTEIYEGVSELQRVIIARGLTAQ